MQFQNLFASIKLLTQLSDTCDFLGLEVASFGFGLDSDSFDLVKDFRNLFIGGSTDSWDIGLDPHALDDADHQKERREIARPKDGRCCSQAHAGSHSLLGEINQNRRVAMC